MSPSSGYCGKQEKLNIKKLDTLPIFEMLKILKRVYLFLSTGRHALKDNKRHKVKVINK